MFLSRWLTRRRLKSDRLVLERRGVWGETTETLDWLVEVLETCRFQKYHAKLADRQILFMRFANVDLLIQQIKDASWVISELETVSRPLTMTPTEMTLDQFLVTNRGVVLRPEEVIKVLVPAIRDLTNELGWTFARQLVQDGYYRRQYLPLISDCKTLLEALVAVSDDLQ